MPPKAPSRFTPDSARIADPKANIIDYRNAAKDAKKRRAVSWKRRPPGPLPIEARYYRLGTAR